MERAQRHHLVLQLRCHGSQKELRGLVITENLLRPSAESCLSWMTPRFALPPALPDYSQDQSPLPPVVVVEAPHLTERESRVLPQYEHVPRCGDYCTVRLDKLSKNMKAIVDSISPSEGICEPSNFWLHPSFLEVLPW